MGKRDVFDVAIVGAGTSGSYTAWRLAEKGFSCCVLEKRKLDSLGREIGPFHVEESAFERFDIPRPPKEEVLHVVREITTWSPRKRPVVTFEFQTFVLDKPTFIRMLHERAENAGAFLMEETELVSLTYERGFLSGLNVRTMGGETALRARLVIDASGIDGAVRTLARGGEWFENDPIRREDTIFVYMEMWEGIEGGLNPGINSFLYYQAWCAPGPGDTWIVGIGMAGSPEGARSRHQRFVEKAGLKGSVLSATSGKIPYRRPPFSLVNDALMVVGDAAFQNKPFSGEGVTSAFTACDIVVDVASRALSEDDLSRESLWEYNRRYFSGQGAKFAQIMASIPAMMKAREDEMEFLLGLPGMMTAESSVALQRDYEMTGSALGPAALAAVAKGLFSRQIRPGLILEIASAQALGSLLRKHYGEYPEHPSHFGPWREKAAKLWDRADSIRHGYFEKAPLAPDQHSSSRSVRRKYRTDTVDGDCHRDGDRS